MPRQPLLTINDAAEQLAVGVPSVRRLVRERRIPFLKIGKFIRFDPADVDAWVAQGRTGTIR